MFHFAVMQELEEHKSLELKEKIPIVIGERIRKARKKNKLSQTELALLLGKDRQYMYKIEKGKVTPLFLQWHLYAMYLRFHYLNYLGGYG
jgi:DNA-binding XRE family transcriptional regulator